MKPPKASLAALHKLKVVVGELASDYDRGLFKPFVEEDVRAYIYYRWLSSFPKDTLQLHLEARIDPEKTEEHADLGFGKTGIVCDRSGIPNPELIVEIKNPGRLH